MKKSKANNGEIRPDIRQFKKSLANTLRGLEIADADPALLLAYQQLLTHLNIANTEQINLIFGLCFTEEQKARGAHVDMSDDEIAQLSNEALEQFLVSEDTPKASLAQIAVTRFSVTKGAVSKLSKEALRLKLQSLIENEKTHQAIERAARSSS